MREEDHLLKSVEQMVQPKEHLLVDRVQMDIEAMVNNSLRVVEMQLDFDKMVELVVHDKSHFPLDLSEAIRNLVAVEMLLERSFVETVQIGD